MFVNPKDKINLTVPSVTGAIVSGVEFIPGQPSTWPRAPKEYDEHLHSWLIQIFQETMVDEFQNVIRDIHRANRGKVFAMEHRGHVLGVAYMCALDAIASYGYKNRHVAKFVRNHFPDDYKPFAAKIYPDYRNNLVHAWNLFGPAALLPEDEKIKEEDGHLSFGIMNFVLAFEYSVAHFLTELETNKQLQNRALYRYREVTGEIKPKKVRRAWAKPLLAGFALGVATAISIRVMRRVR